METNKQLQLALDFIQNTNRSIFLTGKAGTGKTTFLHNLRTLSTKRMAVVAPTGVAAINAGGVTIHSFFQMPFGPHIPGDGEGPVKRKASFYNKLSRDKIDVIKSLDLLVIDEISMVRADLLDGIDEVLRRYRNSRQPFGGIQLLMIGDLQQLSPVVKDEDWQILRDYYPNLYFFSSNAYRQCEVVCIELKHIYRQTDPVFIDLLNSIRESKVDDTLLSLVNERYIANFSPADDEGYITLTTHNHSANTINQQKLISLESTSRIFEAVVKDDFPEYSYPTELRLELKIGAQVMFVKNDSSHEHLFYNGKIGKVTDFRNEAIYVKCKGDKDEIEVKRVEWQNMRYELNAETREVEERVIGTFTQYPLKLAWAITIHKSQGLTFEKAIIDANAAFAHGQVYVALSRCKSLNGIVLRSPLSSNSIKTDRTITEFAENALDPSSCGELLHQSRRSFQRSLLFDLFDFTGLAMALHDCVKLSEDFDEMLVPLFTDRLREVKTKTEDEILRVAAVFKNQLHQLLAEESLPEENSSLQARVGKAANYFGQKVEDLIGKEVNLLTVETDNKTVKKRLLEAFMRLKKEVAIKAASMRSSSGGFKALDYLKTKADAELDFKQSATPEALKKPLQENVARGDLYLRLKRWRDDLAGEKNVASYMILPHKALLQLVQMKPQSLSALGGVKGIGKVKIKDYGAEILSIIHAYCEENNLVVPQEEEVRPKKKLTKAEPAVKVNTRQVSLNLFRDGKSIAEIAIERSLSEATVEGHLIEFISTGELDVLALVASKKVLAITDFVQTAHPDSLTQIKEAMGADFSFGEIKAVLKYLESTKAEMP